MAAPSFLNSEEVERLSDMLLSENSNDLEIGFQILKAHPYAVQQVHRELLLMVHLAAHTEHAVHAKALLQTHFDAEQLQTWNNTFEVFHRYGDLYDPEDFEAQWHWFEQHEAVRGEYLSFILRKHAYVREYFSLAETIAEFYKKRLDWAQRYYDLVLTYNPDDVPTLHRLGNLERDHHHRYEEALAYYLKVLSIQPTHYYTLEAITLLYLDYLEQPQEALSWIQRALEAYPQDEHLLVWLADVYMTPSSLQDFEQGETILNDIIARNPYNTAAWTIYGNHLWITKKAIDRAEQVYNKGLQHNPNSYNLLGNLAELHERVYGDADKARALYLKSFSIYKDDPYHLGNFIRMLVVQLRDLEGARSYYQHLRTLFFGRIQRQAEWNPQQWKGIQEAERLLLEQFPELNAQP